VKADATLGPMADRDGDLGLVRYDVSALDDDQFDLFVLLLRGTDIEFRPYDGDIRAPRARFAEIDAVVEEVRARSIQAGATLDGEPFDDDVPVVAPRTRRVIGWVVDDLVVGVALLVVSAQVGSSAVLLIAWFSVSFFLLILPTSTTGRTVGKAAAGTMVVVADTFEPPALTRSALRWLVPVAPGLIALSLYQLDLGRQADIWIWAMAIVSSWLVYLGVLVRPDRRGVHDLLAGTHVVQRTSIVVRRASGRYTKSPHPLGGFGH